MKWCVHRISEGLEYRSYVAFHGKPSLTAITRERERGERASESECERRWIERERDWVAAKELNLSYYIGETLLFTIYTHYGNLI